MAEHDGVIEQFYPGHGIDLASILTAIRTLPTGEELAAFRKTLDGLSPGGTDAGDWVEVSFAGSRDLGPALMGRPLGPADAEACPELPEAEIVFGELKRAYSARLTGMAGAGKSVCALQAARKAHAAGWKVVRLRDPRASRISLLQKGTPTLHLIDDAHLADPAALAAAELSATSDTWLLTTHTSAGRDTHVGSTRLDAKRAVQVIAAALRGRRDETLAVVHKIDANVSDRPFDESLDRRLDEAAKAELPWQFCFILGGGWRRAGSSATAAKDAGADLVLAAAAIRQIASRDAPCAPDQLWRWAKSAGIPSTTFDAAIDWLADNRLLISATDLRCPHQRFSSVILGKILEGQTTTGRDGIASLLGECVADPAMPLAGVSSLLVELRMAGHPHRWLHIFRPEDHAKLIARCWSTEDPLEIRGAAFVLNEMQSYAENWPASVLSDHRATLVGWLGSPPAGAGYAIGGLLGQIPRKDEAQWRELIESSDAAGLAKLVSHSDPERAQECAGLAKWANATRSKGWSARFIAALDRPAILKMVAAWPADVSIWPASELCQLLTYVDQAFGLDVIEALLPAIADRQASAPLDTYQDLRDTIWHSLRLDDSLGIYTGVKGPTPRMKEVGSKLASAWDPVKLGRHLSNTPKRDFQSAAFLLNFLLIADPRRFNATVAALDWDKIDETIGEDWGASIHDIEVFLGISHYATKAQPLIAALVARNSGRLGVMSTRLALMAPQTAITHVRNGGQIELTSSQFVEWRMGALALATFADHAPDLLDTLVAPHERALALHLSSAASPPFFEEALFFLRVLRQAHPSGFQRILDKVDIETAIIGWSKAFAGKGAARSAAAFLVHHALDHPGPVGQMARNLRERYPSASTPSETRTNRHSPHPDHGGGDVGEGQEVAGEPVVAGCKASEVLELVEAAFDAVAQSIEDRIVGDRGLS